MGRRKTGATGFKASVASERELLGALCAWIDTHDIPPTQAELAAVLERQPASVAFSLRRMARAGLVERRGKFRGFWPVYRQDGAPFESRSDLKKSTQAA